MKRKILTVRHMALTAVLMGAMTLSSCIKDEEPNNECDILNAWIEGADYESSFYQKEQMRIDHLASNVNEIVFTVRSLISLPPMAINFDLTPGAKVSPASGSVQDFSAGPVTYTVTSEDGKWTRQYKVVFREVELPTYKFSFEHAETTKSEYNTSTFHTFYEESADGKRSNIWASGNEGVAIVQYNWTPEKFPSKQVEDGYEGHGLCLNTQYAGDLGKMMGKPIAAGTLFLGSFDINAVLLNPLMATQFGIPIDREPVRVTGYYKYQPGEEFTDAKLKVVEGRVDEANIYAVFYRNQDAQGNKVILHGDDVLSSEYIVSKAVVKSLPPTDKWTRFEMFFEGNDPDPEMLAQLGYNVTLVFASSKDGAAFEGAIGSTLYVDEVEVSFEKEEEK